LLRLILCSTQKIYEKLTEIYPVKHKLVPGSGKKLWLDWSEQLKKREKEVISTLRQEGVHLEACFLSEDEESVYYFMQVEDLKKAYEIFQRSEIPIDREHEKVRESAFESEVYLKKLFVFQNPDSSQ
jgi:L-rhamnose mutarotase